jgi:hypothetical protein
MPCQCHLRRKPLWHGPSSARPAIRLHRLSKVPLLNEPSFVCRSRHAIAAASFTLFNILPTVRSCLAIRCCIVLSLFRSVQGQAASDYPNTLSAYDLGWQTGLVGTVSRRTSPCKPDVIVDPGLSARGVNQGPSASPPQRYYVRLSRDATHSRSEAISVC